MEKKKKQNTMIPFTLVEKNRHKEDDHRSRSSTNTTDVIQAVMWKWRNAWNELAK